MEKTETPVPYQHGEWHEISSTDPRLYDLLEVENEDKKKDEEEEEDEEEDEDDEENTEVNGFYYRRRTKRHREDSTCTECGLLVDSPRQLVGYEDYVSMCVNCDKQKNPGNQPPAKKAKKDVSVKCDYCDECKTTVLSYDTIDIDSGGRGSVSLCDDCFNEADKTSDDTPIIIG